jgi:hypothetical protein
VPPFNISVELIGRYFSRESADLVERRYLDAEKLPINAAGTRKTTGNGFPTLSKNEQNALELNVSKIVRIQKAPLEVVHSYL